MMLNSYDKSYITDVKELTLKHGGYEAVLTRRHRYSIRVTELAMKQWNAPSFYNRKAALAKASPPPDPIKNTKSPAFRRPFSQASLKVMGMQAEPVYP